jgi:hypothetical protein
MVITSAIAPKPLKVRRKQMMRRMEKSTLKECEGHNKFPAALILLLFVSLGIFSFEFYRPSKLLDIHGAAKMAVLGSTPLTMLAGFILRNKFRGLTNFWGFKKDWMNTLATFFVGAFVISSILLLAIDLINVRYDTSPPNKRVFRVYDVIESSGGRNSVGPSNTLILMDMNGTGVMNLGTNNKKFVKAARIGELVQLTTRSGALGYEWVEGYAIVNSKDN